MARGGKIGAGVGVVLSEECSARLDEPIRRGSREADEAERHAGQAVEVEAIRVRALRLERIILGAEG